MGLFKFMPEMEMKVVEVKHPLVKHKIGLINYGECIRSDLSEH